MTREVKAASVILLAILVAAAVGVPAVGAAPSDPRVWVEPARLTVGPGDEFEVQVMIDDVEDLGGFELRIGYDPSVIDLQDAAPSDFLGSTGRMAITVGPEIDQEEGTVALGAASFGESSGPAGSGLLATLTCRALQEGTSPIELQDVEVFNTAPERLAPQVEDGEVLVSEAEAGPADPPDAPERTTPWGWIVAGALVAVVAAAAVAFAVLRGKPQEGSAADSG